MRSRLGATLLTALSVMQSFALPAQAGIFDRIGNLVVGFQTVHKSKELPVIGSITEKDGAPLGHGTVAMVQGRLAIIFAPDSGRRGGGFAFFDLDVSNPNSPRVKLIHQEKHEPIREPHGFGFHSQGASTFVAMQTISGLQIWDWSNLRKPSLVKDLILPGIEESDYNKGNWWVFWQAPYIFVGGTGNGLYVIDAHDIKNPQMVTRVPPESFKLERLGPVYAVGNLLVTSNNDGSGVSTIDISNPVRPRLIEMVETPKIYSMLLNGSKALIAGADKNFHAYSISDKGRITKENSASIGDKGGYLSFQDGHAFIGASKQMVKLDIRDKNSYKVVAWGSSKIKSRDEDFSTVLGPYALISDDHGNGSYWVRHAKDDKNPPLVNMVNPAVKSEDQALTSRIGLTFTDQIDVGSVNEKTFIVRPVGRAPLKGFYSTQTNIVNFTPEKPLSAQQEYQIEIVAGGIKDYWGNPTPGFKSTFKTGQGKTVADLKLVTRSSGLVGESIQLEVVGGSKEAVYAWDLGDGRGYGSASRQSKIDIRFDKPGRYAVSVRAEGKNILSSDPVTLTIHRPLTTVKPAHSSSIAMDASGKIIYNINPDQGTVSATSATDLNLLWEVPTGRDPKSLTVDKEGRVWVTNSRGSSVSVLDGNNGALIKNISMPYGSMPFGIAANPTGDGVLVTLAARGELITISTATLNVERYLRVGADPRAVAITADGSTALISRFISGNTRGEVYRVDLATGNTESIGLEIETTPDTESSGRGLPNYLGFLAISPDGTNAWVPSKKDNVLRGLTRDGLVPDFESSVRAIVSNIDLTSKKEDFPLRVDFNDRDMPVAVAYSPRGDYVFVAAQGSNTVEILDGFNGKTILGIEKVGLAPQGLVVSADGKRLFVHSFLSRQVIAYDISRLDRIVKLKAINVVTRESLSEEVLLGKQVFYNSKDRRMSRDGYISCASCHQDGGEDGRVWDFTDRGEGLRNTITLRGRAGMAQGRVHWTGNFDEIQDFENDIRHNFGGTGFMTDEQFKQTEDTLGKPKAGLSKELDALAAYVTSLSENEKSPYRQADGSFTEEALKGQQVFNRLQCAQCHTGTNFTDSATGQLHNVGTSSQLSGKRRNGPLNGFDTPSLRAIWATPPYLHDGSAATLKEVFTKKNSQGLHGQTEGLSNEEMNSLIQYLLSL